jgi:hypothetical protein
VAARRKLADAEANLRQAKDEARRCSHRWEEMHTLVYPALDRARLKDNTGQKLGYVYFGDKASSSPAG